MISVPEFTVEAEPGKDLGQILRGKPIENAPVNKLAENQAVAIEYVGEHVRFRRRISTVEITETVQDLTNTADDPANACFLGVDFPFENIAEHISLAIERFDSGKVLAVLFAARTG